MKHITLKLILFATAIISMTFTSCKEEPVDTPVESDFSAESPRYMEHVDNCIYFTCYHPTAVARFNIDKGKITGICNLGHFHPEGIASVNGKLFIASSNISDEHYNYSYDNKIYIVDIASFTLEDSVTTGCNPQKVKKLDNTHIAYNTWGDYRNHPAGTYIMDVNSHEIVDLEIELTNFDVWNGDIYGYNTTWISEDSSAVRFYKINGTTHSKEQILTTFSTIDGAYGINLNPTNGDIIVTTDGNYHSTGDCYVFNNDGTLKMNGVQVGNFPSKAVPQAGNQLLVLNEGGWGQNNAEVSLVDVTNGTVAVNFFSSNNSRGLGDIAQDMIVVGNKAFITVSFSNSLEIMDIATGRSTRYATAQ